MELSKSEHEAAQAFARLGGRKGGKARANALTPEERSKIAREGAAARWGKRTETGAKSHTEILPKEAPAETIEEGSETPVEVLPPELPAKEKLPIAKYRGFLNLMDLEIPCYVLNDGQRVIGRTALTETLTGIKGGGGLEKYIGVAPLKPFINREKVLERMVSFSLPEVEGLGRDVKGLSTDLTIEICRGFVNALDAQTKGDPRHQPLTARQTEMAIKAGMFLAACAKVGLDALIDEATGYQYDRPEDALQIKLRLYLEDAMRKWEKTFPEEIWEEFGRLTNWKGSVTKRPKYWGKLVMELVYEYLDQDVAKWLKDNAPAPRHGQNYHQWLSSQYGLKKLMEHMWMLIGIARTCRNMRELKDKMAEMYGRVPVQYTLYLPMPSQRGNN